MKKSFLVGFGLLALIGSAGADTLDDALARAGQLQSGKIQFKLIATQGGWTTTSTLAFQRPDRLHYWSSTKTSDSAGAETHVWLDASKLWVWTSQAGQAADAPKNVYYNVEHEGGIKTGPLDSALGPANFALILLTGSRDILDLDAAKTKGSEIWTSDGDQLVLDPATHLLKQIAAWNEGKKMASADVEWSSEPVKPEELSYTLPAGATKMER